MRNVIIGIHGLGNKPPKETLENWWKLAIKEGLRTNNFPTRLPHFELVYWADILHEKPLDKRIKDENNPLFLDEKYIKAPKDFPIEDHSTRKKIMDFLVPQMQKIFLNENLTLNYSFITDAIVHKYFKDLEIYYAENCTDENKELCKAKDLIKGRLIQTLEKYKSENIMLIGHSMGSIVAYDVLNFDMPNIPVHTLVTMGSPLGLPVVISKIASEQKQLHVPNPRLTTPESVTQNWFNFSDISDKVAFNYMLSDDFEANSNGIKAKDFQIVNNYEINGERNPHKSFGYLRTPEFAKVLSEFILSEKLSPGEKLVNKAKEILAIFKNKFDLK